MEQSEERLKRFHYAGKGATSKKDSRRKMGAEKGSSRVARNGERTAGREKDALKLAWTEERCAAWGDARTVKEGR